MSVSIASVSPRDEATEGLRGLAALMVIYTHMLTPFPHIDPNYAVSPLFWSIETSQGAVLLFFAISGYVIGLTNPAAISSTRLGEYGLRRILRIVPLYFCAVALGVWARPGNTWTAIAGNFIFLQNSLPYGSVSIPPLLGNGNLWSLNYEVLYYLLFPLVWFRPKLWPVWFATGAVLGIAGWNLPCFGALVASYAAGWAFWLAGFALSQAPVIENTLKLQTPWPSHLILWVVFWLMKPLWHIAHRLSLLPSGQSAWMNWSFYDFMLPCIVLLMTTSGRRPKVFQWLSTLTLAIPLTYIVWTVFRGRFAHDVTVILSASAALLWWWRPSTKVFVLLAPVGSISYALYIFHSPLQWLLIRYMPLPSGTAASFVLRCLLILLVVFGVSWFAEKRLQPWLRSKLLSKPSR